MSKVGKFKFIEGFVFKNVGTRLLDVAIEQRRINQLENRIREIERSRRMLSGGESMHYDDALTIILRNNERV
jgi:hypothetical protein